MKHLPSVAPAALVVAGSASALSGVYLLAGMAIALIVAGVAATAFGLLVDF